MLRIQFCEGRVASHVAIVIAGFPLSRPALLALLALMATFKRSHGSI